jgi:hypothetical protein
MITNCPRCSEPLRIEFPGSHYICNCCEINLFPWIKIFYFSNKYDGFQLLIDNYEINYFDLAQLLEISNGFEGITSITLNKEDALKIIYKSDEEICSFIKELILFS